MASIYKRGGKKNREGIYRIAYTDEAGRRQDVSSGTRDKEAAKQIANKIKVEVAMKKRGVITSDEDRLMALLRRPLTELVSDYLAHCRHVGQSDEHVSLKQSQLNLLLKGTGAKVLSDLTVERVGLHLQAVKKKPQQSGAPTSNRIVNQHRSTAGTFEKWCYELIGLERNPLRKLPRLREDNPRRVRRAMTEDELSRLVAVPEAVEAGRADYYTVVTLAGLRTGDGEGVIWADFDPANGTLRIRSEVGKASREDFISLHPQAIRALERIRPADAKVTDRIFPRFRTSVRFTRTASGPASRATTRRAGRSTSTRWVVRRSGRGWRKMG